MSANRSYLPFINFNPPWAVIDSINSFPHCGVSDNAQSAPRKLLTWGIILYNADFRPGMLVLEWKVSSWGIWICNYYIDCREPVCWYFALGGLINWPTYWEQNDCCVSQHTVISDQSVRSKWTCNAPHPVPLALNATHPVPLPLFHPIIIHKHTHVKMSSEQFASFFALIS